MNDAELQSLAAELRAAIDQLGRAGRSADSRPSAELATLALLDTSDGSTIVELARARGVRHQTMAKIVTQLSDAGLARKRSSSQDARLVVVSLTAAGRRTLARERTRGGKWLAAAIETRLTARQRQQLPAVVDVLRALGDQS